MRGNKTTMIPVVQVLVVIILLAVIIAVVCAPLARNAKGLMDVPMGRSGRPGPLCPVCPVCPTVREYTDYQAARERVGQKAYALPPAQDSAKCDFIHVGILSERNSAAPVMLTLYAKPSGRHRISFRYFARLYDTSMPFEVEHNGRKCNDDHICCAEIRDGDEVTVRGFSNTFTAHINDQLNKELYGDAMRSCG